VVLSLAAADLLLVLLLAGLVLAVFKVLLPDTVLILEFDEALPAWLPAWLPACDVLAVAEAEADTDEDGVGVFITVLP